MPSERDKKATYSRDEVEEILKRALQRTSNDAEPRLSRDELVDAARQAGIDGTSIERAAEELELARDQERAIAEWTRERRRRFSKHALTWLVVCGGLLALNLVSSGKLWFQWPLIGWGVAIGLDAIRTWQAPSPAQVKKIQKRERQRLEAKWRLLAKEQARAEASRQRETVRDFESAVEKGVAALLEVATKKIVSVTDRVAPPPRPQTDFERFVAAQKAEKARTQAPTSGAEPTAPTAGPRVEVSTATTRVESSEPLHEDVEGDAADPPKRHKGRR